MATAEKVIPHMGGSKIASWLSRFAAAVPPEMAIVEVGSWLGAGTRHLVREHGWLWVYDNFCATQSEVVKAAKFGVRLTVGQDTLPFVKSHIKGNVKFLKGNIMKCGYGGPPIGLYVDDASKREPAWRHSMSVFEPHFVKGKTILVLQDYNFEPCEVQREYAKKWTKLEENIGGTCAAVFLC